MESPPKPDLELEDNPQFQQREWRVQRICWVFFFAVIIAVMLGVIGNGILSRTELGAVGAPLRMEYQRFLRFHSPDELRLAIRSPGTTAKLIFESQYFKDIGVQSILPEPRTVMMTNEAVSLIFNAVPLEETRITISIRPDTVGNRAGWVAVDNHPRHAFSQFVYP